MNVRALADKITARRKEKRGIARLLNAIAQMPTPGPDEVIFSCPIPGNYNPQFTKEWDIQETDPGKWN
jgi:hypothetical protein